MTAFSTGGNDPSPPLSQQRDIAGVKARALFPSGCPPAHAVTQGSGYVWRVVNKMTRELSKRSLLHLMIPTGVSIDTKDDIKIRKGWGRRTPALNMFFMAPIIVAVAQKAKRANRRIIR